MSLATSCTACGTVFRVVQDQLKVSQGWVRCGRCNEVFNALEGLFDLDRDSAPGSLAGTLGEPSRHDEPVRVATAAAIAAPAVTLPRTAARAPEATQGFDPGNERQDPSLVERLGAELFPERHGITGADTNSRFTAVPSTGFDASRYDAEPPTQDVAPLSLHDSEMPVDDGEALDHDTSVAPEFLRQAEASERWHRPWVRGLLSLLALALLATLALQVAHHWRDPIAARWPLTLPLLAQWCTLAQCTIEAPRRIDDIAVQSTSFARAPGANQFRVSVVLRNRGALALAMPWVDLSLTDASGILLARKALSPQDFRVARAVLEPAGEAQLQLLLAAGTPLVTGYTVEIFYP
ncbi:MAG: zinc-ribbon and DUF3426 domain-containing protein [Burkholderiaceae bacterium]